MFVNTQATPAPRTLLADDQPDILAALRLLLKGAGYQTESVDSPAAVLEALRQKKFDLVLMDLNYARDTTSGKEGLDLISRIRALDSDLPIVVMTAWSSVELAVETMRRGVCDFVQKPWNNSQLLHTLRSQIEKGQLRRRDRSRQSIERIRDRQLRLQLNEAREIQKGLLPKRMPTLRGFSLACAWQPAHTVSGDYLAAFKLSNSHAALCVADVSGKGLPAALLMSNMQAALKSFATERTPPSELCARVNEVIWGNTPLHKFISCFYSILDCERRTLTFTNAGHNPPLLMSRRGEYRRLEEGGRVMGAFADSRYEQREVAIASGDRMLLFTDGVTEACNALGEEFGEERLLELLSETEGCSAATVRGRVMNAVRGFCGNRFADDAALLVLVVE